MHENACAHTDDQHQLSGKQVCAESRPWVCLGKRIKKENNLYSVYLVVYLPVCQLLVIQDAFWITGKVLTQASASIKTQLPQISTSPWRPGRSIEAMAFLLLASIASTISLTKKLKSKGDSRYNIFSILIGLRKLFIWSVVCIFEEITIKSQNE